MNRLMAKPSPELLRKVGLFRDLDEKDLASLADEFNERRFSPGQTIALEGSGGLMFFVVDSGEATVEGAETVALSGDPSRAEEDLVELGRRLVGKRMI